MAKKELKGGGTGEQMTLMDVEGPQYKAAKKEIKEYEKLKDENKAEGAANREAEQAKRKKVFEKIEACELKPDADGVLHFPMDGYVYDISQDAQLRIKKHKAPKEESPDADEDGAGDDVDAGEGAEPAASRRSR